MASVQLWDAKAVYEQVRMLPSRKNLKQFYFDVKACRDGILATVLLQIPYHQLMHEKPDKNIFGLQKENWTAAEWNQVVLSDESRFNLSSDDNRVGV
ncbi:hypothetical protein TNCV_596181 [Trichonephila clavipes]|nr:hypothetical protein TNCV_596181 [Trichonephila clavipes]